MGTHFGARPSLSSRAAVIPFPFVTLLAALLCCGTPQPARALDRDVTLEFRPPESGGAAGYNVYVEDEGTGALDVFDTGHVTADVDGVARSIIVLPMEHAYRVTMTSYGAGGESVASNALLVAAESVCDPAACDDGDPCTLESCDAAGCIGEPAADGTRCDDGFVDTVDDRCVAGVCEGFLLVCRDDVDCDDGNACNGSESCDGGEVCLAGTPLDCPAPGPCQLAGCDPEVGCQLADSPDGAACDDGRADTRSDVCAAGSCVGEPVDDGAPPLVLDSIGPDQAGPGRHMLTLHGGGFQIGTRLDFENGKGRAPRVHSLTLVDGSQLQADVEVSRRGPKRTIYWDVVVTLPNGASARLPRGMATTK